MVTTSGTTAGTEDTIISSALNNLTAGTSSTFPVTLPTGTTGAPTRVTTSTCRSPVPRAASPWASPRVRLPAGPGTVGGPQTETRADIIFLAEHHHGQPEAGHDLAGHRNPLPGVGLERRDLHLLQGRASLEVTPQITPDNRIILDLDVTEEGHRRRGGRPGLRRARTCPASIPRKSPPRSWSATAQAVVLGGILQTQHRIDVTKVPYLEDVLHPGQSVQYNHQDQ